MPLCFIEPQDAIRVIAESLGREARRQLVGEVVRAWVDDIPEPELSVHYAKAVADLDEDDLHLLAAWHASLEVGQPIPNTAFLVGVFPSLGENRREALVHAREAALGSPGGIARERSRLAAGLGVPRAVGAQRLAGSRRDVGAARADRQLRELRQLAAIDAQRKPDPGERLSPLQRAQVGRQKARPRRLLWIFARERAQLGVEVGQALCRRVAAEREQPSVGKRQLVGEPGSVRRRANAR